MLRYTYLVPLVIAFLGSGCSSTLDEYTCSSSIDCVGDVVGRCEPTRHCSFVDETCTSGFRFGDNAGSESDTCVGEDARPPDAGLDGDPIANIREAMLACDKTSLVLDGADSEAFGGKTLTSFEWTLRSVDEQVLARFSGAPQALVTPGIHRLGGNHLSPQINVATYHGKKGVMIDVATPTASGGEGLRQVLNSDTDTSAGNPELQVSFAIGSATAGPQGQAATVRVVDSLGVVMARNDFVVTSQMSAISFEAPPVMGAVTAPFKLEFSFAAAARYFVDNVSVFEGASDTQLARNGSVEGGADPWEVVTGAGNNAPTPAANEDIPASLQQSGIFTVELQVTDSSGARSGVTDLDLLMLACGATGGGTP